MMINLAHFPITPNSGYFRWPWIWNERKSVQNSNLVNRKSAFFVWFEPLNQKREANKILLRLLIRAKTQPKTKSEKYGNLPSVGFATSLPQNDWQSVLDPRDMTKMKSKTVKMSLKQLIDQLISRNKFSLLKFGDFDLFFVPEGFINGPWSTCNCDKMLQCVTLVIGRVSLKLP